MNIELRFVTNYSFSFRKNSVRAHFKCQSFWVLHTKHS